MSMEVAKIHLCNWLYLHIKIINYTKYCIWCHPFLFVLLKSLTVNHPCSVTNIKCKPNIIRHSSYNVTTILIQ